MKIGFVIIVFAAVVASFTTLTKHNKANNPKAISDAIIKSFALLQPSNRTFLKNAEVCHSCHHQNLTAVSLSIAKNKGIPINDSVLNETLEYINGTVHDRKDYAAQNNDPVAIVMSGAYNLWSFWENQYPANKNIELLAKNLMQRQTQQGSWVSPNPRPPLEYYDFTATALVLKGINTYAPSSLQKEVLLRTEKARSWLIQAVPEANEEKAFQLLGLTWANADGKIIQQQAKKLLAAQHRDGGWSQLDSLPTDAYATGQSLYALYQCGVLKVEDGAYQKGISFLLRTQLKDGSWFIKSRSFASVPFVESNFPHGGNQFISAAGANWATMALLMAVQ
jgi:hypothetical protein